MAMVPIQMAALALMAPYDDSDTMMPRPLSCRTRYGMSAAMLTTATTLPSAGLPYARVKYSDCESTFHTVPRFQIAGSSQYDMMYATAP